jgi:hypothetical protein
LANGIEFGSTLRCASFASVGVHQWKEFPMPNRTPVQPKLADLITRYLDRQVGAHSVGLAAFDPASEVLPFEAGPVQPVDPQPAWDEAIAAVPFFAPGANVRSWQPPPDWPQLVAAQEPVVALAFCVGNYPQLMRDLHLILHGANLGELIPPPGRPVALVGIDEWASQIAAKKDSSSMVLALGVLRLAKQFEPAAAYVKEHDKGISDEWRAAWANEKASLAWHSGKGEDALKQWETQDPGVPVLFNRGMAALFLGKPADARAPLTQAVSQLPEAGAWHHLGRLYLALAR